MALCWSSKTDFSFVVVVVYIWHTHTHKTVQKTILTEILHSQEFADQESLKRKGGGREREVSGVFPLVLCH